MADSLPGWHARPAVLDRLPAGRHAVIEASAGTGKTFTLEHLVVELVLVEGVPIEEILVVTFTEKATREMRERVRRKLREVADAAPRPDDAEGPGWTVDAEGRRRLQDALASFDRAPISTIHAFCQRLLSEHAFACARLLEQTAVEPRHAFREAFRQELRVALAPSDPLGPVLTRVLLHLGGENLEDVLYRWAQERGEPALAYEPARVEELLRRLPGQDDLAGGGLWLRLLEAGLQRTPKKTVPALLRKLAPAIDALREGEASLYDTLLRFWDWARERGTKSLTALPYLRKYLPAAAQRERNLEGLARTVDALADLAGDPLVVLVFELLPRVVDRLARQKSALGQFDFDDMLVLVRDALDPAGGPLAASLRALLRRRYRVALVDEFQDTDEVQWTIFRRLFFDDTDAHRLVLIGDPKQAIYGFRNADVHTYHTARAEVLADGGVSAPLTANFRTRASLLEGVDRILREGFFTGVNAYPGPPECGRPELRALRDGVDAPAITLLHLVGRDGPLRFDEARRALAARIAEEVKRILAGDLRVDRGDGPKPVSAADIHVLCRTGAEARQVGEALRDAAVPHAFYKQEGLFQTAIARDILDVLLALGDPRSSALRRAAWRTPFFAVPLERLGDLDDLPPEHPLVDDLYRMARLAEDGRWETLFAELLDGSGFIRRELFWGGSERRLTDAQHVFELLLAEVHQGLRSLPQLTRRLSGFISGRERPVGEDGNVHRLESERRAVQLLTMHKAKGLEAEVVFVVGGLGLSRPDPSRPQVFHDAEGRRRVWIGRPPADVEAIRRAEQRQEDERLLYVALTRARSRLFLPYLGPPPPEQQEEEAATYELAPLEGSDDEAPQLTLWDALTPDAPLPEEAVYEGTQIDGAYHTVNDRLRGLVAEGVLAEPAFERSVVDVRARRMEPPPPLPLPRLEGPGGGVTVTEALHRRLRRTHRGWDVTSYTRMKAARRARVEEAALEELEADRFRADQVDLGGLEETLPGGAATGILLHELLEHLDEDAVRAAATVDALPAEAMELAEARCRAHGVELRWAPTCLALAYRALTRPLPLPDGRALPDGLRSAERSVRELSYLHPLPEPDGQVDRGFVRGVIDLVFEQEGRVYVVDYKSDRLPSYDPETLAAHVETHYEVQARLYTLGVVRAFRLGREADYEARFGGLLYLFLRAEGDDGVYLARPSYDEVDGWERALRDDAEPWGYPLPPRRSA